MVVRGRTNKLPPPQIDNIERKSWLNLLGMLLQDDPCNWEMQVDNLLSKAASRVYILRVGRLYGYTKKNLNLLFESLILSLFYTMELKSGDLPYRINIYNALINSFGVLADLDTPCKSIKYHPWLRKGINSYLQKL